MNVDPHEVLWPDVPFRLHERLILAGLRGSEAHGTYVPPSDPHGVDDRDIMGVCVLPREYYLGLDRWEHACLRSWTARPSTGCCSASSRIAGGRHEHANPERQEGPA